MLNGTTAEDISYEALKRFEAALLSPFRRALDCSSLELVDPAEATGDPEGPLARALKGGRAVFEGGSGRLVLPLAAGGRVKALLVAGGVKAEQLPPATHPFLSSLVENALELVRLRLAAETDPVTGLANEASLDRELRAALSRLKPAAPPRRKALGDEQQADGALALLVLEPRGMATLLDRYGRRFGEEVLAAMAARLAEAAPSALCLARVPGAFVMLLEGGAAVVRQCADTLRQALAELELNPRPDQTWRPKLRMGAALVSAAEAGALGPAVEATAVLKVRALRALACAARLEGADPLFFGEIVDRAGRIMEIMPLDRARIDLGRVHGLVEGERFSVQGGEEAGGAAKAEVVVIKVGEEHSVVELAALREPSGGLRPGDRLQRLGSEVPAEQEDQEHEVEVAGRTLKVMLDEVTGLAGHRSFRSMFAALAAEGEPFAAVLMRVDGLEGLREAAGRVASEAVLGSVAQAAGEVFGPTALLGRHAPDTLAALLPGVDAQDALSLANRLRRNVSQDTQRSISVGVAAHPTEGFGPADALDNAHKALVHTGFFGPDTATAFDAVSLNISGDQFFAQGRLSEAVAEYQRALRLAPSDKEVLNSLGVCYAHLGQMDQAAEYFAKAMAAEPSDFMVCYNLGYALMASGNLNQARQRLEEALELNPDHADTLFQLGRLAQSEGRTADAVELLTKASRQKDCRQAVHRHLGEALAAVGLHAKAEEAFKRALKVNSADTAALAGLANMYLERRANLEVALSLARRARDLEPSAARHARTLARALEASGQLPEAVEVLRAAIGEHGQDAFLALQLGRVEAARGEKAAARDQFLRALALEPNLEAAQEALAQLDQDKKKK